MALSFKINWNIGPRFSTMLRRKKFIPNDPNKANILSGFFIRFHMEISCVIATFFLR